MTDLHRTAIESVQELVESHARQAEVIQEHLETIHRLRALQETTLDQRNRAQESLAKYRSELPAVKRQLERAKAAGFGPSVGAADDPEEDPEATPDWVVQLGRMLDQAVNNAKGGVPTSFSVSTLEGYSNVTVDPPKWPDLSDEPLPQRIPVEPITISPLKLVRSENPTETLRNLNPVYDLSEMD